MGHQAAVTAKPPRRDDLLRPRRLGMAPQEADPPGPRRWFGDRTVAGTFGVVEQVLDHRIVQPPHGDRPQHAHRPLQLGDRLVANEAPLLAERHDGKLVRTGNRQGPSSQRSRVTAAGQCLSGTRDLTRSRR